jgi:hypothetical protein
MLTSTSELMQHILVLKVAWLVQRVGFDATNVVWLHSVQLGHQLSQLLLELAAHTVELKGLKAFPRLSINTCVIITPHHIILHFN